MKNGSRKERQALLHVKTNVKLRATSRSCKNRPARTLEREKVKRKPTLQTTAQAAKRAHEGSWLCREPVSGKLVAGRCGPLSEHEKNVRAAIIMMGGNPTYSGNCAGRLCEILAEACDTGGFSMRELTVLDRDPYRLDRPANHRDGQWFAGQIAWFVPQDSSVHLRGLHNLIASLADVVKPADGRLYVNSDDDWVWLSEHAACAGRWLGYVSFERILEARNEEADRFITLAIKNARKAKRFDADDFLAGRYGPRMVQTIKAVHEAEKHKPFETRWDVVVAVYGARTFHCTSRGHAVEVERNAGRFAQQLTSRNSRLRKAASPQLRVALMRLNSLEHSKEQDE